MTSCEGPLIDAMKSYMCACEKLCDTMHDTTVEFMRCVANEAMRCFVEPERAYDAEWVRSSVTGEGYVCSRCGGSAWYYGLSETTKRSKFCPNCGAKMA